MKNKITRARSLKEFDRITGMFILMILGEDKSRLSKRHGAVSVMAYRDMGYLPEAMINYLSQSLT